MTQQSEHRDPAQGHHGHGHGHQEEVDLGDLLDLDAQLLAPLLDDVTAWAMDHAPTDPRVVVDVGAGTGTGTLALARRFRAAQVVAIDRSAAMLDRLRSVTAARGLADRLRVVQGDLDLGWPPVGPVDVAWAASSLHEVADPDRLLRDVHAALRPPGLLVVVEMDDLPSFLPDDVGLGRPGLETRCHEALAREGWNHHPNWRTSLERAGFDLVLEHTFTLDADPAPPGTGHYAHASLRRVRSALDGRLDGDDLGALDGLLADDGPHAVLHRQDLRLRGSRTAWAARRG